MPGKETLKSTNQISLRQTSCCQMTKNIRSRTSMQNLRQKWSNLPKKAININTMDYQRLTCTNCSCEPAFFHRSWIRSHTSTWRSLKRRWNCQSNSNRGSLAHWLTKKSNELFLVRVAIWHFWRNEWHVSNTLSSFFIGTYLVIVTLLTL